MKKIKDLNKKLHFIIKGKCKKEFRTNDELFKFLNKNKDNIKNIEIFINDYVIVKYDKI